MRTVDLAVYADVLAARASAVGARLERERDAVRQATIEREARRALRPGTVARLEALGVLGAEGSERARARARELAADLAALEELQAWVEARLFDAREEAVDLSAPRAG